MGGRGGASGLSEPQGRRMSMRRFLENLEQKIAVTECWMLYKTPLSM